MLWVLKRTISVRRLFWAPKTYAKNYGQEKIYNFMLKIFVYNLNLCVILVCEFQANRHDFEIKVTDLEFSYICESVCLFYGKDLLVWNFHWQ